MSKAFWNGLPTEAFRGTAIVADAPEVPMYWARDLVGERIAVVKVILDGVSQGGGVMHIDDRDGWGWVKVSSGGNPRSGHARVTIVPGSFLEEVPADAQ